MRNHQRLVVKGSKEPERKEVKESGEEHALDVRDKLGLSNQPVKTG